MSSPPLKVNIPKPTALGLGFLVFSFFSLIYGLVSGGLVASFMGASVLILILTTGFLVFSFQGRLKHLTYSFTILDDDSWRLDIQRYPLPSFFNLHFSYHWVFTQHREIRGTHLVFPHQSLQQNVLAARGLYSGIAGSFLFTDSFNCWRITTPLEDEAQFIILSQPRFVPEESWPAIAEGIFGARHGSPLEKDDRFDTRPYFPGDDIRHLHWKIYAHTGDLILRKSERTPPPRHRFVILLDPWVPAQGKHALFMVDKLVELIQNWLHQAFEHEHDVVLHGPNLFWESSMPQRALRLLLAGLTPTSNDTPWPEKTWPNGLIVVAHPQSPQLRVHQKLLSQLDAVLVSPKEWV